MDGLVAEELLEPFTHQGLERQGCIRLVELAAAPPISGNQEWLPECRLRHVDLTQRPLYTAVSYNCSSEPALSTIKVDGKGFKVRKNVLFMLKQLSKPKQTRTLWIDCICIHQDDVEERNAQVGMMGDIFAHANFVLSWLDPTGLNMDNKLSSIARIARKDSNYELHSRRDIQLLTLLVLSHRYWTRRWIVQEECFTQLHIYTLILFQVLLARSVVLTTGPNTNTLEELPLSSLSAFYEHVGKVKGVAQTEIDAIANSPAKTLLSSRTLGTPVNATMRDLLLGHKDTNSSDVRDKVFALASLSPKAKLHLDINYAASPAELLFSVVKFAIEHEGCNSGQVVGLFLQLKRQLSLSRESLWRASQESSSNATLHPPNIELVSIFPRGHIRSSRIEPLGEAFAYHYRDLCPALRTLPKRGLQQFPSEILGADLAGQRWAFLATNDDSDQTTVSGQDLCMFTFYGHHPTNPYSHPSNPSYDKEETAQVGLSSAWVEPGNEIWQFPDTPVALVVCSNSEGYRLVGRAFLLTPSGDATYATNYSPQSNWPSLVDTGSFLKRNPKLWRPTDIKVDFATLLDILEWIDYDD